MTKWLTPLVVVLPFIGWMLFGFEIISGHRIFWLLVAASIFAYIFYPMIIGLEFKKFPGEEDGR